MDKKRTSHNPTPERIPNNTNKWKVGISRKNTKKRIKEPEKTQHRETLTYVATYNKNNPELFIEIIKNLELKNKDKIKEIFDTTKIIKGQGQPENLKRILTSSTFGENTTQGVNKCNSKWWKMWYDYRK